MILGKLSVRRMTTWGIDLLAILAALPLAYMLRFNLTLAFLNKKWWEQFLITFIVLVPVRFFLRYVFHLQRMVWQYTGIPELQRLVLASTVGTLIAVFVVAYITRLQGMPRSVFILEWGVYLFLVAGARIAYRMLKESWRGRRNGVPRRQMRPVIVIGAGTAGNALVKQLAQNPEVGEYAVAFVDDDPAKYNGEVLGLPVYGPLECLPQLVPELKTRRVYIAVPSAASTQMRRIVAICEEAGAEFLTLPSLGDVVSGRVVLHQLRPVRLEDLLGRESITIETERIAAWLQGKRVLVTGAAGSIGSELCRQLLTFGIAQLTLLEQSEFHLYLLQHELQPLLAKTSHRCVVGSVNDQTTVAEVMENDPPHVIFHAAAYKHVFLMEKNPRAALVTNALGTFTLCEAASKAGVEHFVLVSSDKAVRPTSVMGATKKLAEEICLGLSERSQTAFHVVRFGNVIGSSGSVVPLFERQLAAGGPLTVTHPEVTRFFMTIPEAVRLILQAVTMGQRGEVFLLDMGKPVKILDLAEQMIRLAGKEPHTEVPIEFIGLQPGEKLHEDLWHPDERVLPTAHPKVLKIATPSVTRQPKALLAEVQACLQSHAGKGTLGPAIVALANLTAERQNGVEVGIPTLNGPSLTQD